MTENQKRQEIGMLLYPGLRCSTLLSQQSEGLRMAGRWLCGRLQRSWVDAIVAAKHKFWSASPPT